MKRNDFLRRMKNRRRGDQLQLREPADRRAIDWRTLRVDLPEGDAADSEQEVAIGTLELSVQGVRLHPNQACWVRGYRTWQDDAGKSRAEFQYKLVEAGDSPPPGATAVAADEIWNP